MTEIEGIFNELYDSTYQKTLIYVTAKCSKLHDVEDILQEIYTEVYSVLLNKGREYIQNEEAFVIKIAKTKIFRHYSLKQRLSAITLNIAKEERGEGALRLYSGQLCA
ncbi:MAG: hypothetical protein E7591_02715 [Ruminococcaceae bacterium]|nr:hypothetical protein [Oscillospiraceae bacterium]